MNQAVRMEAAGTSSHDNDNSHSNGSLGNTGEHSDDIQSEELGALLDHSNNLEGWLSLIHEICDSAESSVEVLNDLLNYDKISMGNFTMEFSVLSVWQLVQETSREFRLSARKKNIEFTLDTRLLKGSDDDNDVEGPVDADGVPDSLKIVGDRIRLAQVLRNLVSNALKFSAEEGMYASITTICLLF